jgi:hypothetical protein
MKNTPTLILRETIASVEQIEQRARRVGEACRKALAGDKRALAELGEVVAALAALQTHSVELVELHCLLQDVLIALTPFHAFLVAGVESGLDAAGRQVLLQNWRPCQRRVDALADFAETVESIGHPFRREGHELEGERWVVEIIALQAVLEDGLKEDELDCESLFGFTDDLANACHRHLTLVDHKLKSVARGAQRLSMGLSGGKDG